MSKLKPLLQRLETSKDDWILKLSILLRTKSEDDLCPKCLTWKCFVIFFLNYQLKIAVLWLDQNVGHFLLDLRLWVFLVAKQKGPGLCRSTLGIFSINIHNLGDNTPGGVAAFIRNFGEEKCRAGLVGILQKNGDCLTKQPVSKISSPNKKSKSWYKRRRMWYNNLPP